MNDAEEWRPIPSWLNYEVSNHGRVRSVDHENVARNGLRRRFRGKLLKRRLNQAGYWVLSGRPRGGSSTATMLQVHLLVLEAFRGPRPEGMEGCHNDGDPANCHLSNLRWDTHKNNIADIKKHGHDPRLNRTVCSRGHQLAHPNLDRHQLEKLGKRLCKACRNAHAQLTKLYRRHGKRPPDREAALQELSDRSYQQIMRPQTEGEEAA